jgi:hypothetical protein
VPLFPIDLASEMAAARQRRDEKTARLLRESRVRAIQASVRPGSSREDIEECARSFYPRLRPDLLEEAIALVCASDRSLSTHRNLASEYGQTLNRRRDYER